MAPTPAVRPARGDDVPALHSLMNDVFRPDPVSEWLFPRGATPDVHADFFALQVDLALRDGAVWTTHDLVGCMLWYDVPEGGLTEAPDDELRGAFTERLDAEHEKRLATFDRLTGAVHPHEPHAYLAFIAVAGDWQGKGRGGELLGSRLAALDEAGLPAYLEASTLRSARLYERLGFRYHTAPVQLPDGPQLYPMWRRPGTT